MTIEPGQRPSTGRNPEIENHTASDSRRIVWYWLPVAALCIVIFVQSSFPSPDMLPSFEFSDKLMHILAYGVLAILVCRALNSHASWQGRWLQIFFTGVITVSLYGLSDEWHQSFVVGRYAQATDWIADLIGSVAGSGALLWILRRRHPD